MAITYKLDTTARSMIEKGISSNRPDYAVRSCIVRGLTNATTVGNNTNGDLKTAIDTILNALPSLYHPDYPNLPLDRARVKRWGGTKAYVDLIYSRRRFIVPPGEVKANYRTGFRSIPWYRARTEVGTNGEPLGHPSGPMVGIKNLDDPDQSPRSYQFNMPTLRILVPTWGLTNPIISLFPFVGKINAQAGDIFGDTFGKFTVRFDGMASTWNYSDINNASAFDIQYQFTAVRHGWYEQIPVFGTTTPYVANPNGPVITVDGGSQNSESWFTVTALAHDAAVFPSFPLGAG